MNVATLLFPGQTLPYHVVDYAINWARENEGSLNTLFMLPREQPSEGYPFPNDLDEAEEFSTNADARKRVKNILKDEIRYIEKRAKASHIPINSEILFGPTVNQVLEKINNSDVIFFDKNLEGETDAMNDFPFSIDELSEKGNRDLFAVGEQDRYSDVFY
jgi:hypothetical protein